MQIDGKVVGRALAAAVRPVLRELGFSKFQARHAWRRDEHSVSLVTFPSMTSYIADGVGCTSFSFSCEVGASYPNQDTAETGWPRGYDLDFRAVLGKTVRQPFFHPWGQDAAELEDWQRDRPDVWYVLEDGSNLDEVVADAAQVVLSQGIPFIDMASDTTRAIRFLDTEEITETKFGSPGLVMGRIGSPMRVEVLRRLRAIN